VSDGGDREADELGLVEVLLVAGAEEDAESVKFSSAEVACAHDRSESGINDLWRTQFVMYIPRLWLVAKVCPT
jgi:hypothetical protein